MVISPLSPSEAVTATDNAGVSVAVVVAVADKDTALAREGADQAPLAIAALLLPPSEDGGAPAEGWNLDVLLRGTCIVREHGGTHRRGFSDDASNSNRCVYGRVRFLPPLKRQNQGSMYQQRSPDAGRIEARAYPGNKPSSRPSDQHGPCACARRQRLERPTSS